ncbi:unnamed protein product [Rodentolepis nana]|uniref:Ribonuclease P n=1 Tax=Rodentolepis nana TaxID=102285 RepID=A0A0R3TYQ6_RODNA|nr:unnamed protein product [Rodentolepis nana]
MMTEYILKLVTAYLSSRINGRIGIKHESIFIHTRLFQEKIIRGVIHTVGTQFENPLALHAEILMNREGHSNKIWGSIQINRRLCQEFVPNHLVHSMLRFSDHHQ